MSNFDSPREPPSGKLNILIGRIIYSPFGTIVSKIPPIPWIIRGVAFVVAKRQIGKAIDQPSAQWGARVDLQSALAGIVRDVVDVLGYTGAMVATYEQGDVLPARALYVDPELATLDQIKEWEKQVERFSPSPEHRVSITDPNIARVYVHQDKYKNNLSVKAAKAGKPIVSNNLFDLFTPVAPDASRDVVKGIQEALRIKQVIAIPFFLDAIVDDQLVKEYVGNLFAATQSEKFRRWEIELLEIFGQQAAAGLTNANLYRKSENRRDGAQILGRMAFSASASVHTFRNHIGVIRGNLQLLGKLDQLAQDDNGRRDLLDQLVPPIMDRLNKIADILERLHTPWNLTVDRPVDVNACLIRALDKVIQSLEDWVHVSLAENLPSVYTSEDMLTEAFRVLIKNAVEAMVDKGGERSLQIESRLVSNSTIEVVIHDNGLGIRPENFDKVFELRWTTKNVGLGFGLFWTRDYVEGFGGKIRFESIWEEGTTFTISLPATVGEKVEPQQI